MDHGLSRMSKKKIASKEQTTLSIYIKNLQKLPFTIHQVFRATVSCISPVKMKLKQVEFLSFRQRTSTHVNILVKSTIKSILDCKGRRCNDQTLALIIKDFQSPKHTCMSIVDQMTYNMVHILHAKLKLREILIIGCACQVNGRLRCAFTAQWELITPWS